MNLRQNHYPLILLIVLVTGCLTLLFGWVVIQNFSNPIVAWGNLDGDTDLWEFIGFFLEKHIQFIPFPKITFLSDQIAYPYGAYATFLPWSFERDLFYSFFYSFLGLGPWLQIYYLLSIFITAVGAFLLLQKEYGYVRAAGVGFLVSFCNFHAISKYPKHISLCILHWTVLSFIVDFLIVKYIVEKRHIPFKLILLRACLLVLVMGQELGYVAGFSLMSLTVSMLFVVAVIGFRQFQSQRSIRRGVWEQWQLYQADFRKNWRVSSALLVILLIVSSVYLPLVIQLVRSVKGFDFSGLSYGFLWTHPLRLVIPYLPGIDPPADSGQVLLRQQLQDFPGEFTTGRLGWFPLILGAAGLWQARKSLAIYIPLITIAALCVLYHPGDIGFLHFPTLKIFPWFAFNRNSGRSTLIYPVILGLFALGLRLEQPRSIARKVALLLLVALACTEFYTAYSLYGYKPYHFDKTFFEYVNYVKRQPGEAVLDWPFCVYGASEAGQGVEVCPYYNPDGGAYSYGRFYEKKVMGVYMGRPHPSLFVPYQIAGWGNMFSPNHPSIVQATMETRCFGPEQWAFFTDFFRFNNFAGINLYLDRLPEQCIPEFYDRFGQPAVTATFPRAGRVAFIPKSAALRRQVDPEKGRAVRLQFPVKSPPGQPETKAP